MKPKIGIDDKSRRAVCEILQRALADEVLFYIKIRNFHWNVTGPHFHDRHKLFESQYEAIDEIMDDTAERIRALGGFAEATSAEFAKRSQIKERPGKVPASPRMVAELLDDHELIIRSLREDLEACQEKHGDAGTADFLTGVMEQHEKMAWMLRATLES